MHASRATADFSMVDPHRMMRKYGPAEGFTHPLVHAWLVWVNITAIRCRDCLETPKGLPFVVPRACETGCKAPFFDASRYQQTRDPIRPATFQTVSPRTWVNSVRCWAWKRDGRSPRPR